VGEVAESVGGEAKLRFVKDGNPVNISLDHSGWRRGAGDSGARLEAFHGQSEVVRGDGHWSAVVTKNHRGR
jgi:hypothetical protein